MSIFYVPFSCGFQKAEFYSLLCSTFCCYRFVVCDALFCFCQVAEQVGNSTLVAKALHQLEDALDPWLQGANSDALVYDSTWGGLISTLGVENQDADFGNGW